MKRLSELERAWPTFWRRIDPRPIWEWAEDNVRLPHSARHTEFRVNTAPQIKEPLTVLSDNRVEEVTVIKPVQGGGSTIAEAFVPWIITQDPGPLQWNWETDEKAKRMAETRIRRMLEATEPVARLLVTMDRHKKRTQSIIFPHMSFHVQGADSLVNLQSDSIRWQINDEIWNWQPGRLDEARHRTDAFDWNRRILNISTAGCAGPDGSPGDDCHRAWLDGDQRVWCVPCPKCGHHQPMKFRETKGCGHIVLDHAAKRTDGKGWDYRKLGEPGRVRWKCCACGHEQVDDPKIRRAMNAQATYIAQNKEASGKKVSFNWNSFSVSWKEWAGLAIEFLKRDEIARRGDLDPLREYVQKEFVEFWDPQRHDTYEVIDRPAETTTYQPLELVQKPDDWDVRFMTIDVQQMILYVVIADWKRDGSSRRIYVDTLEGYAAAREVQLKYGVKDKAVFVDTGWDAHKVYEQCLKYGWTAIKGEDAPSFTHGVKQRDGKTKLVRRLFSEPKQIDPSIGRREGGHAVIFLFLISKPTTNAILERLKEGRGAPWLVFAGVREDYWKHLASWVRKDRTIPKTGEVVSEFYHLHQRPDHFRDCERYQVAAAAIFKIIGVPDDSTNEPEKNP